MKISRRILALVLAAAMLFSLMPTGAVAFAAEATEPPHDHDHSHEHVVTGTEPAPETQPASEPESTTQTQPVPETQPAPELAPVPEKQGVPQQNMPEPETVVQVNPVYQGILTEDDLVFPEEEVDPSALEPQAEGDYLSVANAALVLREKMKNRTSTVTLYVRSGSAHRATMDQLFAAALAHTGVPTEGDSLKWQYGGWRYSVSTSSSGGSYLYTYSLQLAYYTTASQERQLDTAVDNLLAQLNLDGKTDYEKVCILYDYITDTVEYDYAHLNNEEYTLQFTAYAALINRTAVCQGIAVLLYRLCLELGIDNRVITSIPEECHAWSIVGLDGWFYLCDATWDLGTDNYNWFLRGSNHFPQHTAAYDDEYRTAEFTSRFPINPNNYAAGSTPGPGPEEPDEPEDPTGIRRQGWCGDNIRYTLTNDGVLTLSGTGETYDYPDGYASPWEDIASEITRIEVGEGIRGLGEFLFWNAGSVTEVLLPDTLQVLDVGVFQYCVSLESVELPQSLTTIGTAAFSMCESLREITIPSSVTYIGDEAFIRCYSLEDVRFEGSAPELDGEYLFWEDVLNVHYPAGNSSWNSVVGNDYGGSITWIPYVQNVQSAELVSAPDNVSYMVGETLDLAGLQIRVYQENGSSVLVGADQVRVISADLSSAGIHTVVLEVYGFQVSFQVYVHEQQIVDLDPSIYPESDHDYGDYEDDSNVIRYPGAGSLALHFSSESRVESYYDRIYVYDGNDNLIAEFTGNDFAGTVLEVPGDTARIRLTSDSSVSYYGYSFDLIQARVVYHPGQESGGREATCTEEGITPTVVCEICGQTVGGETIPALGHDWDDGVVIQQPEGANPGVIRYTCRRCDATRDDNFGEILDSGIFGENSGLTWTLWETGMLVISGEDSMGTQEYEQPWASWNHRISDVQIQEGVTSVGDNAFGNMTLLERISLPSTITRIGSYAFDACYALTEVTIPAGVDFIGDGAFINCSSLGRLIFLGGKPSEIAYDAFHSLGMEIHYPVEELSWNRETMQPYGGSFITWIPEGEISALQINTLPDQLNYGVGDYFNSTGLRVDAVLPGGEIAQLHNSCLMIENESTSYMGVKNVTVSRNDLNVTFQIFVHVGWEDKLLDSSLYPESEHNYTNNLDDTQSISYSGARSITLTFSQDTQLENSYDRLYVMDGSGTVWFEYTGAQAAGQTVTVYDDVVQIRMVTDVSYTYYGYSFSSITANTVIHTGEVINGREPTCTEDGVTSCILCSVCGQEIGGQILPALGHDWDEGRVEGMTIIHTCRRCGTVSRETLNPNTYFSEYEWDVLRLTNRERLAFGLSPLTGFDLLQQAGEIRAEEIQELFEHQRPNGTSCFTVLDELGILRTSGAENIAYGYTDPGDVMVGWMNSDGHRANILRSTVNHVGVGYYQAARRNWVQMFTGYSSERYTSMTLFFPNGLSFPVGTEVDEMNIYAVLDNNIYGKCFLPIMEEFASGYNPSEPGDQEVTITALGFSQTFTVTRGECVHSYEPEIIAPDCENGGYTTYTCSLCGDSYVGDETDPLGHNMSQWIVSVEPGCGTAGEEYRECVREGCDYEETHEIAPLDHDYVPVVTEPDCENGGYTTYTCSLCGNRYVGDYTDALGHLWDEGEVIQPATGETAGIMRYRCTRTGCDAQRDEEIPVCEHEFNSVVTQPTCTEQGYTTYTCLKCGYSRVADYTDPLDHDWSEWVTVTEAGCVTAGLKIRECARCEETEEQVLPELGHDMTGWQTVTEPSCGTAGLERNCCSRCDYNEEREIPAPEHNMSQWIVTVEPECETAGEEYRECVLDGCDHEETREIPPLGHDWNEGEVIREVTADTPGIMRYTCLRCSVVREEEIPVCEHEFTAVVTQPTCTDRGYTTYTCGKCGHQYVDDYTPFLGHDWIDPNADEPECGRCGYILRGFPVNVDLTALGEDAIPGTITSVWVDGVEYPAEPGETGFTVTVPTTEATNLVVYTMNDNATDDVHTQYPVGMKVWMLKYENDAYTATYIPEFDNLLQYAGSSIRIVGVKGIRMITAIDKNVKKALTSKRGLAGYTLVEYGTALGWAADINPALGLTLGQEYTKSNYAYKKGEADPVFKQTKDQVQYTNVLVGFDDPKCVPDIAMRPYIILEDAEGNQITIYGGMIYRSIGYIAYQNRNAFQPKSPAYEYVWGIIHYVYGDKYDEEYQK